MMKKEQKCAVYCLCVPQDASLQLTVQLVAMQLTMKIPFAVHFIVEMLPIHELTEF